MKHLDDRQRNNIAIEIARELEDQLFTLLLKYSFDAYEANKLTELMVKKFLELEKERREL